MTEPASRAAADVKSAFGITIVLLTFVGGGLPAVIAALTEDVVAMRDVLALTLPVSVWVGVTVYVFLATTWSGFAQLVFAMVSLTVLTVVGNAIGAGTGVSLGFVWELAREDVRQFFVLLVTHYFLHYGPATFVSALVVGAFLGFAWWRLLDGAARTEAEPRR